VLVDGSAGVEIPSGFIVQVGPERVNECETGGVRADEGLMTVICVMPMPIRFGCLPDATTLDSFPALNYVSFT